MSFQNRTPRAPHIRLPAPGTRYDQENEAQTRRAIEQMLVRFGEARVQEGGGDARHFRQKVVLSFPDLEPEKEYTGEIELAGTVALFALESDFPMWLRLYETEAAMDDDAERDIADDPTTPVVLEVVWLESDAVPLEKIVLRSADGSGAPVLGATRETEEELAPKRFWYRVVLPDYGEEHPALALVRASVGIPLYPITFSCCNNDCEDIHSHRKPLQGYSGGNVCAADGAVLGWSFTYVESIFSGPSRYNYRNDETQTGDVDCLSCPSPCTPTPDPCPGGNPDCQPKRKTYIGKYMPATGTTADEAMPLSRVNIACSSPTACGSYSQNWFGRPRKNIRLDAPLYRYSIDGSHDSCVFAFGMPAGTSSVNNLQVRVQRSSSSQVDIAVQYVNAAGEATNLAAVAEDVSFPTNTTRFLRVVVCNDKVSVWFGADENDPTLIFDEVTIHEDLLEDGLLKNSFLGWGGSRGGTVTTTGISPSFLLYTPLSEDMECEFAPPTAAATLTFLPLEDEAP